MPGLRGWLIRCNELGANENSNEPHPCRSSHTRTKPTVNDEAYSSPENLCVIPQRILVRSQRCVKRGGRLLVASVSQICMGPRVAALSTELVQPPMMSEARAIGVRWRGPVRPRRRAVAVHPPIPPVSNPPDSSIQNSSTFKRINWLRA